MLGTHYAILYTKGRRESKVLIYREKVIKREGEVGRE